MGRIKNLAMASIFHQPHTFNFFFFKKSSWTCCPTGVATGPGTLLKSWSMSHWWFKSLQVGFPISFVSLLVQDAVPVRPAHCCVRHTCLFLLGFQKSSCIPMLIDGTFHSCWWKPHFYTSNTSCYFILSLSPVMRWYPPDHRPTPGYTPHTWLNLHTFCCLDMTHNSTLFLSVSRSFLSERLATASGDLSENLWSGRLLSHNGSGAYTVGYIVPDVPLFNGRLPSPIG